MPSIWLRVACTLLLPVIASAGEIYGTLREGTAPRGGVAFQVLDGTGRAVVNTATAPNGTFRFSIPNGRYTFRVERGPRATASIYSSPDPAQYDFELVRQGDGSYSLVRR